MKTPKNLLMGAAVFCFFTITAKAQTTQTTSGNPWHFGVGVESGITTSGIFSKTEIGATARLQYDISRMFAVTLTSGYYEFLATDTRKAMGMIPVKLGTKVFVGSGFYLSGEIGAGIETQPLNALKNFDEGITRTTTLVWSAGFGYSIKSWDLSLRYESFSGNNKTYFNTKSNFGLVGLRVGYTF